MPPVGRLWPSVDDDDGDVDDDDDDHIHNGRATRRSRGLQLRRRASPWNSLLLTSVAQHTCRVVDDGDDDDNIKF